MHNRSRGPVLRQSSRRPETLAGSLSLELVSLCLILLGAGWWIGTGDTKDAPGNQGLSIPLTMTALDEPPAADGAESPATVHEGDAPTGHTHAANHLVQETSPYLLMHAHNPVDWYPWGEDAFAKARRENKPIFLSVGYSSCYWCHVMERESFQNEEIAAYLNEHYVCIKVDREERPDVDDIYMTAVQLLTRGGGWPLSVFLTPDAKPFYGGTYFPPERRNGLPSFREVIEKVHEVWTADREEIVTHADDFATTIAEVMQQGVEDAQPTEPNADLVEAAVSALEDRYDPLFAGFSYSETNLRQPKFPEPSNLRLLLQQARGGNAKSLAQLEATLRAMLRGGIYDHLGGGFHRYSTDRFWWVPHFEKMLYDNASLASIYAQTYELTGEQQFATAAQSIAEFVLREMTAPEGGFYSALDAETDHEEGKYYAWSEEELAATLQGEELALFKDAYVWTPQRFESTLSAEMRPLFAETFGTGEEPHFELGHVLMLWQGFEPLKKESQLDDAALESQLAVARNKLLERRLQRQRPLVDTKVLTAWNGLMIAGMADTGRILQQEKYTAAAIKAAEYLLSKHRRSDGRLLRTSRKGEAKLNAYLDDYAFLTSGLLSLHQATGDDQWLSAAIDLTRKQVDLFWDENSDGFYFTSHDHENLIARSKDYADNALPAGNSVSVENLSYLADATGNERYREHAMATVRSATPLLNQSAGIAPRLVAALAGLLGEDGLSESPGDK